MKCECGKELTEEELQATFNLGKWSTHPLCFDCMNAFAHHAVTGEQPCQTLMEKEKDNEVQKKACSY